MELNDSLINLILIILGTILPPVLGMLLPRKRTIQYGIAINKFLGTIFFQKRVFKYKGTESIWQKLGETIQTTFQDLSFGVYISGRTDLTKKEKQKKIDEYLIRGQLPRPQGAGLVTDSHGIATALPSQ